MTKSCVERIQDIENINVYRAIVAAITTEATWVGGTTGAYYMSSFPDPVEYAAKIDVFAAKFGDGPVNIEEAAKLLGPNSGQDYSSMAATYDLLKDDLNNALRELDKYWEGDAADQFIGPYMSDLGKHLGDLADACDEQKNVSTRIWERITKAQGGLVETVKEMVRTVVTYATLGPAIETVGIAGTAAMASGAAAITVETAGIGAIIIAATVSGAIIYKLVDYHNSMSAVISDFNTDLGSELMHALEGIQFRDLRRHVDGYASKAGWLPSEGVS